MKHIDGEVASLVTLGAGPHGERRHVPLGGGTVAGTELSGTLAEGGIDWRLLRADGVLESAAHHVIRADDGVLIEVRSDGLRHGPGGGDAAPGARRGPWHATNTSSARWCA
jgi:hypothetical protein